MRSSCPWHCEINAEKSQSPCNCKLSDFAAFPSATAFELAKALDFVSARSRRTRCLEVQCTKDQCLVRSIWTGCAHGASCVLSRLHFLSSAALRASCSSFSCSDCAKPLIAFLERTFSALYPAVFVLISPACRRPPMPRHRLPLQWDCLRERSRHQYGTGLGPQVRTVQC